MTAQELELAVLYALNPPGIGEEAANVKTQATRYCEEVKHSKDGWRLALEVFRATSLSEARFFSLGCLQDALGARAGAHVRVEGQHDRYLIREGVMGWLKDAGSTKLEAQEPFVRTKVAVVLALLIKIDYPEVWADPFEQMEGLVRAANGGAPFVDLYLRVLGALDEEVVTFHVDRTREEADHNSRIKDTMRTSQVVTKICGLIYEVVGAFKTESPQLAVFALETLRKYIGWIDIGYVVNDRFLGLFAECLRSPDEQLVQRSCSCILEVVNKKMADPVAKLHLLQQLKLAEMLKRVPLSDETVAVRVAELVDGVIQQLLTVWDKLEPVAFVGSGVSAGAASLAAQAGFQMPPDGNIAATAVACSEMLREALPMLWACLAHPDVDVAVASSDAVSALLQTLRRQLQDVKGGTGAAAGENGSAGTVPGAGILPEAGRFRAMDHLPQLLTTLYQRMKYPPEFSFDPNDEDEGEEDMLRQQLRKHYVNAGRQAPEAVLGFLCQALSALPTPLSSLPFPDLEAALRLIFHFSEGCGGIGGLASSNSGSGAGGGGAIGTGGRRVGSPAANRTELLRSGAFPQMVLALHDSDVSQHKHPQVLMLYFQLTVRYSRLLSDGPPHLMPKILEAICGPQGLGNADVTLRTRSCYFLTKLVKAMREEIVQYADVIVTGVQALLDSRDNGRQLSDEAKLNLYETIGYLVGMRDVPVAKQVQHLDGVLGPQLRRVADNLRIAGLSTDGKDADSAAAELAASVGAMANLSKGFRFLVATEVEARFFQALEAATSALMAFPHHVALRAKSMFLIHGLISCLGESLLRGLSVNLLLLLVREGEGRDLMEVTQLLNQLTIEYGPKSAQLLDAVLLPYVCRTYELIPGAGSSTAVCSGTGAAVDQHCGTSSNGSRHAPGEAPGSASSMKGSGVVGGNGFAAAAVGLAGVGEEGRAGNRNGNGTQPGGGGKLLAHEVAERSAIQKLYLSVLQHVSSNGLAGVLSSPTNGSHLDSILRSVLACLAGEDDAITKKTCLYIFALLLGGFNRGRSGGRDPNPPAVAEAAGAGAGPGAGVRAGPLASNGNSELPRSPFSQKRSLGGKGGSLWTGTEPTVDLDPAMRAAVTSFVLDEAVPAAIRCLMAEGAAGLDLRDATALSATVHMGTMILEGKVASGGSAAFVGAAAVKCNCPSQVARQLQQAVEESADASAVTSTLKAFSEHMRPPSR